MDNIMKYIDNAIMIAYRKGLLPSSERLLIPQVMRNGEYLTESLIRRIWDYNATAHPHISGGEENRMIFRICGWAGIYTTNSYFKLGYKEDEDIVIAHIQGRDFDTVDVRIRSELNILLPEKNKCNEAFTQIAEDTFNTLYYDNLNYFEGKKAEAQWETIKETALILYYVGMVYERHRSVDKFSKRPMNWWE